jgi:predicted SnoaL-like aldol condensation-catalyzing enzyme
MNTKDPKLVALQFNECINNRDLEGLALLMTDDYAFIDREDAVHKPKETMVKGWKGFFEMFPKYKNTFTRVESEDNLVVMLGFAYWTQDKPYDPAIWTATIVNGLVKEWRIYTDTEGNRKQFNLF